MPSLGGTALAVGCLSESMEGALREHGVLGGVAEDVTIKYDFLWEKYELAYKNLRKTNRYISFTLHLMIRVKKNKNKMI